MQIDIRLVLLVMATCALAFVICFVSTPLVRMFAHTVGAVDIPQDERRMHKKPITRLGGLAIFLGFIFSVILFADINRQLQGILLGAVVIVVLGILDDILRLDAWIKFIVQIGAALIPVFHGVVVEHLSNPNIFSSDKYLSLGVLSIPVTVIWIVVITNSVNLIDGLDGLAAGVSTIASFTLLVIAIMLSEPNVAVVMAALMGGCLGFLPYNLNPAKMFMGDTGATFLGYILATVSIQGLFKFYAIISFAVPFLILGLPIFDTAFAIIRRIMKGQSPMHADRSHVHHRLIDMGFSQKQSVAILYAMSAILGLAAVVLTSSGEFKALLLLLVVLVTLAIGSHVMLNGSKGPEDDGAEPTSGDAAAPDENAGDAHKPDKDKPNDGSQT